MGAMKHRAPVGASCPTNPDHGPTLDLDGRPYCPHQDHDGRPKTHPAGAAARTNPYAETAAPLTSPNRTDVHPQNALGRPPAEPVTRSATPEPADQPLPGPLTLWR